MTIGGFIIFSMLAFPLLSLCVSLNNNERDKKTKIITWIVLLSIIAGWFLFCWWLFQKPETTTSIYELSELDDGIYGYYTLVTSGVPAHNYEMITVCLNGQVYTLKGDVNIIYDDTQHQLIYENINLVNSDTMTLYVPYDSIEFMVNIGVG